MPTDHRWRLVRDGPYRHFYVCTCGWQSRVSENGLGGAGADLCRHEAHIVEERGREEPPVHQA